jgi:hypothetical protein
MFNPVAGVLNRRNFAIIAHSFITGTAGAIASQDLPQDSGVIATKTATKTGRYTFAVAPGTPLAKGMRVFHGAFACIQGVDDAVYGAKTKGGMFIIRDNDMDRSALDGTFEGQFLNPSTDATNYIDAELPDGAIVYVVAFISF